MSGLIAGGTAVTGNVSGSRDGSSRTRKNDSNTWAGSLIERSFPSTGPLESVS